MNKSDTAATFFAIVTLVMLVISIYKFVNDEIAEALFFMGFAIFNWITAQGMKK